MAIPRNLANFAPKLDSSGNPTFTAPTVFSAGTVSLPSITFTGDTNTGIFSPTADTIAFTEGGAEAMRIDSSGRLLVGATTARSDFFNTTTVAPRFQVELAASDNLNRFISVTSNNSDTGGSTLLLAKSRGTTVGAVTIVQNDDQIGAISFQGADGVDMVEAARVVCSVDGTPGSDDMPGRLVFFTTADGAASPTERMRITAAGNVGIGTASPTSGASWTYVTVAGKSTTQGGVVEVHNSDSTLKGQYYAFNGTINLGAATNHPLLFLSNNAERGQFTADGYFCLGKSDTNNTTNGVWFSSQASASNFQAFFCTTRADGAAAPVYVNRQSSDGSLIIFQQANTQEGDISVSGNTVSYNAFAGSHWSQFQQGRGYNPEVPRGTVLSTIGEMCEWKSVEWAETIEHEATEDKEAWTETIPRRETYLGNLAVGATFEEDGVTKTVVDDGNERLPKVKISDVAGDKAVYGVFQTYDSAQDLLVTSLGAFVVRIAAGVTVQIGDLLESNGDGCAKVQDDDIIRSKTIGKVTSTTATATYDDGSYTVPCVLYCG